MQKPSTSGILPETQTRKRSRIAPTYVELAGKCVKKENSKFYCAIDPDSKCEYSQTKYEVGNMIRHFRSKHAAVAGTLGIAKNEPPPKKQRFIPKRQVAVDRRMLLEACLKLVTQHHLPLQCFEWEGLKMLLDPLAAAVDLSITRANIKMHLENAASKIKGVIMREASDKLISIMLDSASRHGRHILGVSIQYSLNDKLVIRTLGKYLYEIYKIH